MENHEILEKLKADRRIAHNKLDEEIMDNVAICLADLEMHGIRSPSVDEKILSALRMYNRAQLEDDTVKSESYLKRYEAIRDGMMMAQKYRDGGGCGGDE